VSAPAPDQPAQLETLAGLIASRVKEMQSTPERWMDRPAVMEYSGFGASVVSRSMNGADPALHCHRLGDRGHPRTKQSVVDAWVSGASLEQQRQVCGCPRLHRWKPE
jgi:hypothetical protein